MILLIGAVSWPNQAKTLEHEHHQKIGRNEEKRLSIFVQLILISNGFRFITENPPLISHIIQTNQR